MSKELIVDSSPHETRVAILEDDRLVDIYIERASDYPLAGSIFKGRVSRVLPGMQSAFVDIGLGRDAFLYVSDFLDDGEESDAPVRQQEEAVESTQDDTEESGSKADPPIKATRRERRSRRSRRKPPRREGFPESKYAPLGGDEASPQAAAPIESPPPETDFQVLPGESLAKYRDRPFPTGNDDSGDAEPAGGGAKQSQHLPGLDQQESTLKVTASDSEPETTDRQTTADGGSSPSAPHESDAQTGQPSPAGESTPAKDAEAGPFPEADRNSEASEPSGISEPARGPDASAPASSVGHLTPPSPSETPPDEGPSPFERERKVSSEAPSDRATGKSAKTARSGRSFWARLLSRSAPDRDDQPEPSAPAGDPGSPAEATTKSNAGDHRTALSREQADNDAAERNEGVGEPAVSDQDPGASSLAPGAKRPARARLRGRSSRYFRRGRRRQRPRHASTGSTGDGAAQQSPESESTPQQPRITDLLSEGQEVLVQISKEPLGRKGARITSHIALPGRYLVYMPTVEHTGVSRKILSEGERRRLRKAVIAHHEGMPGGFIVRTAGEGVEEAEIADDMKFLYNLWLDLRARADSGPAPSRIHRDLDVVERILRDQLAEAFKTIWVEGDEEYERILRFVERFQPDLLKQVKLYTRRKPIFDEFNITAELEKALRPKVWLKSGGYLVINQTEALVAIDVNTGKYVGKSDSLEETIVNTNLEAVQEVVRQMRLRDLGGIIVVDFIDMEDRTNRRKVMAALEQELELDRAPSKALRFNDFGLVAITRKRVKQSLERTLCTPCPYCHGSAYVKSSQTIVHEILAEAKKMARSKEKRKDVTLRVNQEVARVLKSRENSYLQDIEQLVRSHVLVRSDVSLHREKFGFR